MFQMSFLTPHFQEIACKSPEWSIFSHKILSIHSDVPKFYLFFFLPIKMIVNGWCFVFIYLPW